jgi:hypothetical protein
VEVGDRQAAVPVDLDDLVLPELPGLAGVPDERGDVGTQEVLAVSQSVSGSATEVATSVKAPSSRRQTARMASARRPSPSGAVAYAAARRWAATSVSVSEANSTPDASHSERSPAKFSMIPLWITATDPSADTCGWALRSVGPPWVAQRVCPIPIVAAGRGRSASTFSRLASLPAFFAVLRTPSATTATPAES